MENEFLEWMEVKDKIHSSGAVTKFSEGFMAIPLTSQPHSGTWYVEFNFRGKQEYAVLSQIRMMSVSRLYNRMGKLSTGDFKKIQASFKKLIK